MFTIFGNVNEFLKINPIFLKTIDFFLKKFISYYRSSGIEIQKQKIDKNTNKNTQKKHKCGINKTGGKTVRKHNETTAPCGGHARPRYSPRSAGNNICPNLLSITIMDFLSLTPTKY